MFQLLPRSDYMIVTMFYRFIWYSVGVTPSNSHFKDVYKDWLKERIKVRRFREYQHFILSFSLMKKLPERQTSFSPGQGSKNDRRPGLNIIELLSSQLWCCLVWMNYATK